ncbi:MAG: hypothetical protein A2161_13995 [Candidatus Schekmanbacteria bacterium RBG_13_48_7]|uniref:Radical SAM protein n=1 Tax=Candidatus Schekmanbacteria bacterium RBG_13_48_7 TaxID=1817878 RepID=A0A1F7RZC1_9BACT|nr:MAG: hypothetical protein A2161_13995 [Candidatus Schekmanbacteria bacterium RBG_13_48_7]
MRIVLVPTIVSGLNVDQIGPIFRFALDFSHHITGISVQPAAAVGRKNLENRREDNFNLADLAIEFGKQTNLTKCPDDWFPLNAISSITMGLSNLRGEEIAGPSCDAHCSLGAYFYVDEFNKAHCINHFFNLEKFFHEIANVATAKTGHFFKQIISRYTELKRLERCFDDTKAPRGLTFQRMLQAFDGWEDKSIGRNPGWNQYGYNGIFVAGMHFMDSTNFNIRRLHRCIIHYVTLSGKRIPFCNYNAGLRIRNDEEAIRNKETIKVLDI